MKAFIIVALFSYFCGSVPFGYLLVRIFKGKDVRSTGSGNIGATNVARTAPALGIATLLLDAAKGFFPFWLTARAGVFYTATEFTIGALLALAALLPVLGHMFPVWLKFKGGKGVATAVGVYLALSPWAVGISFLIFLAVLALSRFVSLASVVSAIAFPAIAYWQMQYLRESTSRLLLCAIILISILIILKHHANIRRLMQGTENRFGRKTSAAAELAKED